MQSLIFSGKEKDIRQSAVARHIAQITGIDVDLSSSSELLCVIKRDLNKSSISIDSIRLIKTYLSRKPTYHKYVFVLIEDAQYLSPQAQNALLKIAEEPPEFAQIILSVDHKDNLLPTLVSRCIVSDINKKGDISEYTELDDVAFVSIVSLIKSDLGERIDWVGDSKGEFKDKEFIVKLLNSWEKELRKSMLYSVGGGSTSYWNKSIVKLQKLRSVLETTSANPMLAVESFLVNL